MASRCTAIPRPNCLLSFILARKLGSRAVDRWEIGRVEPDDASGIRLSS
jgi:hypothetical protein